MPLEISVRRNLQRLLGSLKYYPINLWEEEASKWAYWQLLLPSKTYCKVYYESWCPQLGQLICKNGNDCYKTDSDLERFFYGRERIKRVHSKQKFIADPFYGRRRIKRHHHQQMFYGGRLIRIKRHNRRRMLHRGRQIIICSKIYKQAKRRKERGSVWEICSYTWSAEIF